MDDGGLKMIFQSPVIFEENMLFLVKMVVLMGALMFLAFAVVVIRQVKLMKGTVVDKLDGLISVVAWVLFLLIAIIFLLALFYL